jgi:BlaI family transcriptional regulator, penicillinase repressor
MPREPQDVTEAELAVMQRLWEAGRASIRQLADALYGTDAGAAQYATVQKQLERLEAKGFVARDRSLYVHVFSPAIDRDELIGRRIRAMAEKLCGGSLVPILSHLARSKGLSRKERQALRELIDSPGATPPASDAKADDETDRTEGGRGRRGRE